MWCLWRMPSALLPLLLLNPGSTQYNQSSVKPPRAACMQYAVSVMPRPRLITADLALVTLAVVALVTLPPLRSTCLLIILALPPSHMSFALPAFAEAFAPGTIFTEPPSAPPIYTARSNGPLTPELNPGPYRLPLR
jgi:hypothetical protein